jgi:Taurine catabolism dioxygenase TauD, TfdA family
MLDAKYLQKIKLVRYPARNLFTPESVIKDYKVDLDDFSDATIKERLIPAFEKNGFAIVSKINGFQIEDFTSLITFYGQTLNQGGRNQKLGDLNYFLVEVVSGSPAAGLTNKDQAMHIDGIYFNDLPGVMVLHCQKQASFGGESIIFDGLKAYQFLSKVYPEGLEALKKPEALEFDLPFQGGKKIKSAIFKELANGKISFFYTPYAKSICGSPEAEKAFKLLCGFVHSPKNQIKFQLNQGEFILLDNWRFTHGRMGFPSSESRLLNRVWYQGNESYLGFRL